MLNFSPQEIDELKGSYLFCMDKVAPCICDDWEAMYKLLSELAKKKCESPDAAYKAAVAGLGGPPHKPCGKCLRCRARKLLEEES